MELFHSHISIINFPQSPLLYYTERANDVIRRVFVFCGHIGEADSLCDRNVMTFKFSAAIKGKKSTKNLVECENIF